MDVAETHHLSDGPLDLASWDWRAELKHQERSIAWLARQTRRSESAVNKYAGGHLVAPVAWLKEAAIVLGVDVQS